MHLISSLLFYLNEFVRMWITSFRQSVHTHTVYYEHYHEEQPYIVTVRVKPKRQHPLVCHDPFYSHSTNLSRESWPNHVLWITFWQHETNYWQHQRKKGTGDGSFSYGEFAWGTVKVELGESEAAAIEGEVIKVVVLIEAIAAIDEFFVPIIAFHHFVDKVECRYTC